MKVLNYTLTTLEPVMITGSAGGDPNSEISLDYIPGSSVRGALIERWDGIKDALDSDFQRLFLNGSVQFLHAYPCYGPYRYLPAPRSWRTVKDDKRFTDEDSGQLSDFAVQQPGDDGTIWKRFPKPFAIWNKNQVEAAGVASQIAIHTARESRQKPTVGDSTVFRYDSIAGGQRFAGAILAHDGADLEQMACLLMRRQRTTLGRSRSAEYGWVEFQLTDTARSPVDEALIQDEWHTDGDDPDQPKIYVTLTSDMLVRDPLTGAYSEDLGVALGGAVAESAFTSTHLVGGFNRKWNLPLPQATAIAAGSVFVYPRSQTLADQLAAYAETGIGERCAEGFGRIALGLHQSAELPYRKPGTGTEDASTPVTLSGESRRQAENISRAQLRKQLDGKLADTLAIVRLKNAAIENNQLARLRVVVRRDRSRGRNDVQSGLNHLADYLKNLKSTARTQLARTQIDLGSSADGAPPLLTWLEALVADPKEIWSALGVNESMRGPSIAGVQATVSDADAVEYAVRLIDRMAQQSAQEANHG